MINITGHWEILDCVPNSSTENQNSLDGLIFELKTNGEVIWKDKTVNMPLCSCDTYEIIAIDPRDSRHYLVEPIIRFGTYRGHILDFSLDILNIHKGELVLSKNSWLIRCKKVDKINSEYEENYPFSLLPALENGFFSDLEMVADNNKTFQVHSCILKLAAPNVDWSSKPIPLNGLPEEVLGTTLHYLYAQCLPDQLSEKTTNKVISSIQDIPDLADLVTMCKTHLCHLALEKRLLSLAGDVHTYINRMVNHFEQKHVKYDAEQLSKIIKYSERDAIVSYINFQLISHCYFYNKSHISIDAEHKIIEFIQKQGQIIITKAKTFLSSLSSALIGLDASQRSDLACILVSEIETFYDTASSVLSIAETCGDILLNDCLKQPDTKESALEQELNRLLIKKDMTRFDCILTRISYLQQQVKQKKEDFKLLSDGNKIRFLVSNLDQLIEGLPIFLLRLEDFTGALDMKLDWDQSKFLFKVCTSKLCDMQKKLVDNKELLEGSMIELCRLVDREEFSNGLVELGFLKASSVPPLHTPDPKTDSLPNHFEYKLDLKSVLSEPPSECNNALSAAAANLLDRKDGTDMVFEIMEGSSVTRISAHRVIVAARCAWFRRALLSGMQEDINRRIEVHNSTPALFQLFLKFLYSGKLSVNYLQCCQLIELLVLSDCYEVDSLKNVCEVALKRKHLREDSALELLSLADQLNAQILRYECIEFLSEHDDIMDEESFADLSVGLQEEVYDAVRLKTGKTFRKRPGRRRRGNGERRGEPDGQAESEEGNVIRSRINRWSTAEMESAVDRLRLVIGHTTPRVVLEGAILAAHFNLPKALDLLDFGRHKPVSAENVQNRRKNRRRREGQETSDG